MGISSLFILLSICMFLQRSNLIPQRYKNYSYQAAVLMEIIICFFVIELFLLVVWLRFEACVEFLIKRAFRAKKLRLYEEMGGDSLLGFFIITISTYFFMYSLQVTENGDTFSNLAFEILGKLQPNQYMCQQRKENEFSQKNSHETTKNNQIKRKSAKPAIH